MYNLLQRVLDLHKKAKSLLDSIDPEFWVKEAIKHGLNPNYFSYEVTSAIRNTGPVIIILTYKQLSNGEESYLEEATYRASIKKWVIFRFNQCDS